MAIDFVVNNVDIVSLFFIEQVRHRTPTPQETLKSLSKCLAHGVSHEGEKYDLYA